MSHPPERAPLVLAPVDPLFTGRWSPRAFSAAPLPEEDLQAVLEAARWAPSCFGEEPWVLVHARRGEPGHAALLGLLNDANRAWAAATGALVAVLSRDRFSQDGRANPWAAFDAGAAWMSLALQAHLRGLHTHAMGGFDRAGAAAALGLDPEAHTAHCVVAVGHRGDPQTLPAALQAREKPSPRKARETRILPAPVRP